jgi:hypothetical protein
MIKFKAISLAGVAALFLATGTAHAADPARLLTMYRMCVETKTKDICTSYLLGIAHVQYLLGRLASSPEGKDLREAQIAYEALAICLPKGENDVRRVFLKWVEDNPENTPWKLSEKNGPAPNQRRGGDD